MKSVPSHGRRHEGYEGTMTIRKYVKTHEPTGEIVGHLRNSKPDMELIDI